MRELTDETLKKNRERSKIWREQNKEYVNDKSRKYYQEQLRGSEIKKQYDKKHRIKQLDGFYTIYYLPEDNYIGLTSSLKLRMREHKKNTDNYQIIATFTDKREALDTERMFHDVYNFNGKNPHHQKH